MNKCDKVPYIDDIGSLEGAVKISAKTGEGIDRLLDAVAKALPQSAVRAKLLIPFSEGGLLNEIRTDGKILSEEYTPDGILCDALVDVKIYPRAAEYKVSAPQ